MNKNMHLLCPLYPCFDTLVGATFKRDSTGRIVFDCASCSFRNESHVMGSCDTIDTIEGLYFKRMSLLSQESTPFMAFPEELIALLKSTAGICKNMVVLAESQKKEALDIELSDAHQNIGIYSALRRDISIAFAHDSGFRPPMMPVVLLVKDRNIVGEMTSSGPKFYKDIIDCDYVLPPVPFPEAEPFGIDIVSASPGYLLDAWIRKKIELKKDDATLVLGLNLRR